MPVTYNLIASNTLSSSAASVTFSAIPNTYTDLVLRISARGSAAGGNNEINLLINGSTSSIYSNTNLFGDGGSAGSNRETNSARMQLFVMSGNTATANTFSSHEVYLPNYLASTNKPLSSFNAQENNLSTAYIDATASLFRDTAAITSLTVTAQANFVTGSSFFLYGIKNS
jgi:hypothetical protein